MNEYARFGRILRAFVPRVRLLKRRRAVIVNLTQYEVVREASRGNRAPDNKGVFRVHFVLTSLEGYE